METQDIIEQNVENGMVLDRDGRWVPIAELVVKEMKIRYHLEKGEVFHGGEWVPLGMVFSKVPAGEGSISAVSASGKAGQKSGVKDFNKTADIDDVDEHSDTVIEKGKFDAELIYLNEASKTKSIEFFDDQDAEEFERGRETVGIEGFQEDTAHSGDAEDLDDRDHQVEETKPDTVLIEVDLSGAEGSGVGVEDRNEQAVDFPAENQESIPDGATNDQTRQKDLDKDTEALRKKVFINNKRDINAPDMWDQALKKRRTVIIFSVILGIVIAAGIVMLIVLF